MRADGILIYVRDVKKAAAFYRSALGFSDGGLNTDEFTILQLSGLRLYLHRDPDKFTGNLKGLEARKTRGDGVILHIEVADVDAWAAGHEKADHPISLKPTSMPFGQRQCYVYDPDGYNVAIFTPIPPGRG